MPVDNTQANTQDPMGTSQNMAQPSPSGAPPADGTQLPGGLNSDDVAAALGYITTLSQHMFHGTEEDPNAPQDQPPGGQPDPKADLNKFKQEIQTEVQSGLEEIKNMVKDAITKDGNQDNTQ